MWEAYEELATCRTVGMVAGPIPWTAIRAWGERYGLTLEEEEELREYIRTLDAVMLERAPSKGAK